MAEVKDIEKDFNDDVDELSGLDGEKKKGEITSKLDDKKITEELETLKLKFFKEENGIAEGEEIPEDLKEKYSSFALTDDQKRETYENYREEICDICADRDRRLNALLGNKEDEKDKGKIGELENTIKTEIENRENEINDLNGELEGLDPEKDKDKIEEINGKITTLNGEIESLKTLSGRIDGELRQPAIKAFGEQNDLRVLAYNTLSDRFGNSLTSPDMEKIAGKKGAKQITDQAKEQAKDEKGEKEQGDKTEENKEEQEQQGQVQGATQKGGQQAKGGNISPEQLRQAMANAQAAGQVIGDDIDLQPDLCAMLGYNPDNVMNFENSASILDRFANDFTDKTRLEMLNDPEAKKVILDSLRITGKNLSPKKAKMFDATRMKILKLAKGPMMEMALKDIGIENPENIKKEFNEANKEYNSKRKELEDSLNKEGLSEEDKRAISNQITELDNKYASIRNVADFQKSSNQIKTLKSRIISFKDAILNKDTYTQTVKTLGEKTHDYFYEKPDDEKNEVTGKDDKTVDEQEHDTVERPNSWTQQVNNKDEVASNEAKKIEEEKQNPTKKVDEKAKEDIDSLSK